MTQNHKILNRMEILKGALNQRNLSDDQSKAIEKIIDGFCLLISDSTTGLPSKEEIEIFSEIIKSSLTQTLKILKVYVKSRESQEGARVITGQS